MLSREGARLHVFLELNRLFRHPQGPRAIIIPAEWTTERPWGWLFCWTTRGWYGGDDRYAPTGPGPVMIRRDDARMTFARKLRTVEESIRDYEAEMEREASAWELIIHAPADCPLSTLRGIRSALRLSITEVGELRKRLPCAIGIGARVDLTPIHQRLVVVGVVSEIRRLTAGDAPA